MTIGDRIKWKRLQLGWSQVELAKAAGISQQLVTRLETGKQIETTKARPIARAFGMTTDELLGDEELPLSNHRERLGALIRQKRNALGMTQSNVADWIGVTKGAVSHWEQGRVDGIEPENFCKLAKLLKFDESDIQCFGRQDVDVFADLPLLPPDEMEVIRLYAALPQDVRAHVRGIIETLSARSST